MAITGSLQTAKSDALFSLAREAFSGAPFERYFDFFCGSISEFVPFSRAILATFEDGQESAFTSRQEFSCGCGDETSWLRNLPATTPANNTCMAAVVKAGKPSSMPSLTNKGYSDLQFMRQLGFDSCLMIPLITAGRTVGLLILLAVKDRQFSSIDQDFLMSATKPLSSSLNQTLLQETLTRVHLRLKESEKTDWLTGLYTRKYFVQAVENELARASRFNQVFALLFVDADNFKDINTRYGHAGGDKALKHISNILKKTVRPFDIVCRYGGEDFAVLLPQTGREGAMAAALRLCGAVRSAPILLGISDNVTLTISIGAAAYPKHGDSLDTVMQQADRAMFSAKACGGNTIASAD